MKGSHIQLICNVMVSSLLTIKANRETILTYKSTIFLFVGS